VRVLPMLWEILAGMSDCLSRSPVNITRRCSEELAVLAVLAAIRPLEYMERIADRDHTPHAIYLGLAPNGQDRPEDSRRSTTN
jgi:hypothetical protein